MANAVRLGIGTGGLALEQWRSVSERINEGDVNTTILGHKDTPDHSEVLIDRLLRGDHDAVVVPTRYLPTRLPGDVVIRAVMPRRTPFASLLTYDGIVLDDFESGAVIGVDGAHQVSQLLYYRPELRVVLVPGGVQQRLTLLTEEEIDGLVVPASWAEWLNIQAQVSEILSADVMVPVAGQGSLSLLGGREDSSLDALATALNDSLAFAEVAAERRLVQKLRAGGVSLGAALLRTHGEDVTIDAMAADVGGRRRTYEFFEGARSDVDRLVDAAAEVIVAQHMQGRE